MRIYRSNLIIKFFENKSYRYSFKKGDRKKFNDYYLKFYENYSKFLENDQIERKVGEGIDKVVFSLNSPKNKVIKLYKTFESFVDEKNHYQILINQGLDNLLPEMIFYDQYCIIDRTYPLPYTNFVFPKQIKKIIKDDHRANFGIVDDKIVVVDLGAVLEEYIEENLEELRKINRS